MSNCTLCISRMEDSDKFVLNTKIIVNKEFARIYKDVKQHTNMYPSFPKLLF